MSQRKPHSACTRPPAQSDDDAAVSESSVGMKSRRQDIRGQVATAMNDRRPRARPRRASPGRSRSAPSATSCARPSTRSPRACASSARRARSRCRTPRAAACTRRRCARSSRRRRAETIDGGAAIDRSLSLDGRTYALRAYPISGRRAVLSLRDTTDEREDEVRRLQAEKLASIGMLAAGVAHEINNPTAFVLANIEALTGHLRLLQEKVRELPEAVDRGPRPAGGPVRGDGHPAGVEGGHGAHPPHRARPRLVLARRRRRHRHARRQRRRRVGAHDAAQRDQVPRAHRARPALDAGRARQPGASRAGLPQHHPQRRAGARRDGGASATSCACAASTRASSSSSRSRTTAPASRPRSCRASSTRSSRRSRAASARGSGCPISLGIIRSLGGQLTVDSRPGEGATFRVRLPACRARAVDGDAAVGRHAGRPASSSDAACSPSTTSRSCSRPTAACSRTSTSSRRRSAASRRCARSSATPSTTSSCAISRCPSCRAWACTRPCASAGPRSPTASCS